jgi:hypothetical protein
MKTLSEYENERRDPPYEVAWLGVACDRCRAELYNPSPGIMLTTDPPKINVRCSKCDFSGYMTR